jgi:hypothetical protein
MKTKICSKCKEEKELSEFTKHPQTNDGLQCQCKQCRKNEKQNYYLKNKEHINKKSNKYREDNREQLLIYQKKYREKNKVTLNKKKRQKYEESPEIFYLRTKLYIENNKEKVNKYKNQYNKKKKKESVLYRLRSLMRDRLNKYTKYKSINKNNTTFEIIGCTPQFLKEHLENQFVDNMNWDNQGLFGWHIDHIIPLSSAKTEEELYKLCNYSNLQPLWAEDNLKKGNKILI